MAASRRRGGGPASFAGRHHAARTCSWGARSASSQARPAPPRPHILGPDLLDGPPAVRGIRVVVHLQAAPGSAGGEGCATGGQELHNRAARANPSQSSTDTHSRERRPRLGGSHDRSSRQGRAAPQSVLTHGPQSPQSVPRSQSTRNMAISSGGASLLILGRPSSQMPLLAWPGQVSWHTVLTPSAPKLVPAAPPVVASAAAAAVVPPLLMAPPPSAGATSSCVESCCRAPTAPPSTTSGTTSWCGSMPVSLPAASACSSEAAATVCSH